MALLETSKNMVVVINLEIRGQESMEVANNGSVAKQNLLCWMDNFGLSSSKSVNPLIRSSYGLQRNFQRLNYPWIV